MFVKQIELKHFRCFAEKKLQFDQRITLIEGINGSGKTSLLEALHYACYLRSFRTYSPRELTLFDQDTFHIKVDFEQNALEQVVPHNLHVGYSHKKRLVKLNNKAISSYKELMDHFRIITLTEDDLGLIKLGPDLRRQFIDQAIALYNPDYMHLLKEYRTIIDNRNKLLQQSHTDREMYHVWSEQLWHKTLLVQAERKQFLMLLQEEVNKLLKTYFPDDVTITFAYKSKMDLADSWQTLSGQRKGLFEQEKRFGRSLFGAHLDDMLIAFQGTMSRTFASRGQQKLIMLLIKVAQVKALDLKKGPATFLLDDFMTDFDQDRAELILDALGGLESQLIFTAPIRSSVLGEMLQKQGAQIVGITD